MAKRGPQSELTDRNWDDEEEPEECGIFKQATNEAMQQRVVKKAKRRVTGDETGAKPGAFGGFGGFAKSSTTTTPFSGQSQLGTPSFKPTVSFNTTGSVFSGASSTIDKNTPSSSNKDKDKSTYLPSLKSLNESVLDWIKQHVEKNPYICLTPIFKDYEKHYESLQSKKQSNGSSDKSSPSNGSGKSEGKSFGSNTFSKPPASKEIDTKDLSGSSSSKPFTFDSTAISKNTGSTDESNNSQSKTFAFGTSSSSTTSVCTSPPSNLFAFAKSSTTPTISGTATNTMASNGFSFGSTTSTSGNTGFSFSTSSSTSTSGFSFTSTTSSSSTTAGNSGFSFGALAAKAISDNTNKVATSQGGDDDDYVPPKPEVKEIQEEGAIFSKRCKLFYQKEGQWTERGVGNVHLKPLDGDKTQLLIRADTNLGNILLNINVTGALPVSRQGKNNVVLVCVPNPPLKEGDEPKPISMLVRVKTGEEADELLQKVEERKKLVS